MNAFNLSGTLNAFRVLFSPSLSIPHATVSHFSHLPTPLATAFTAARSGKQPDIRAVVLDKDNCFAVPYTNEVDASCRAKFDELRKAYPGDRLLIVSNSAGATASAKAEEEARILEQQTQTAVLRHVVKKPGCGDEIMKFFRSRPDTGVTHASQVAVIGDRVFTDVVLANMMGANAIWIRDGVVKDTGLLPRFEKQLVHFLLSYGFEPSRH
ncbi:hypothetical protein AMS68_000380 [Peltaster fructicola]|uniref:Uncharacterized protein n=1 Tax=Peltaster fructicola TaxID=286661 RepID=A0A6H0XJF7_9PEZI|nr:hypothetical protein AMS68_000380 [Peltaster fructicola]